MVVDGAKHIQKCKERFSDGDFSDFFFSVILTPVGTQLVEVWNLTWGGTGADKGGVIATTEDSMYLAGDINYTCTAISKGHF
ncbi:MAG TPA: hypothetical protein C5S37_13925 [Methanophagales archaeon]|nr:hypothetical protein [Methanophagales archaeon]